MDGFAQRLSERAELAGIALTPELRDSLANYFAVLSRWNAKMNLTSLIDGDEAIDRLLVEPVAAAAALPLNIRLMDLGSGGGSPAIPLALALNARRLVMVESRERKAAFLREACRLSGIPGVVETARFEELSAGGTYNGSMDAVSIRAVRMDELALSAASTFLTPNGNLALFVTVGTNLTCPRHFSLSHRRQLVGTSELLVLSADVPRGTLSNDVL